MVPQTHPKIPIARNNPSGRSANEPRIQSTVKAKHCKSKDNKYAQRNQRLAGYGGVTLPSFVNGNSTQELLQFMGELHFENGRTW